ncbi:hypothetical protein [Catellatospora chokoriensis]|uniref:Uncharacterized protein n=1 Tax=Catellatospora chokoriensis TaxID=310353 RepID=A0A8J3K530_9ACTN|nr:hypothetical protein [Catellatospora chokoriensis]GIF92857.1 hypothetical protein Cch02nite_63010 [Catellatospora chokoriensis]
MGIDEKFSNLSRRCAGRSMELVGKITHNTRWQIAGYTTWMAARDDETREKAKDAAKAMDALSAYGMAHLPPLAEHAAPSALGGAVGVGEPPTTTALPDLPATRPVPDRVPGGPALR